MFDNEAETLTYEPVSFFLHQISTTDTDSPRLHKISNSSNINNTNKNNSNSIKSNKNNKENNNKTNDKNVMDKNHSNKSDINSSSPVNLITKRHNGMNRKKQRRRQSLMDYLSSSMTGKRLSSDVQKFRSKSFNSPGIVRSQTIQEGGSQSCSKPITARLKVREKRRMTLDNKPPSSPWQQPTSHSPLTRSKSDVGTYDWSKELTREEMQKKCRELLKARLCVMDTSSCESFSEADSYLDTSSSSFYELFPNDKRYRQLSSSPSSGFGDESEESEVLSFSRTSSVFIPIAKTSTTGLKVIEVAGVDHDKNAETKLYSKSLEKSRRPSSIVRSQSFGRQQNEGNEEKKANDADDNILVTDGDSESDDVKYKENNGNRKVAAIARERKQKRKICKSDIDVLNDITHSKTDENISQHNNNDVGIPDVKPVTLNHDASQDYDATPAYDVIDSTNDVASSPSNDGAKEDGKLSLEQYVDKLSRKQKVVRQRKSVGKNIRIESVL